MRVDVLFDPFGGRWQDLVEASAAAERAGFDGIWLYDHLAGSVHGASHVLECWTSLTAIAASVPRVSIGSMVLNVANRLPGTLAVMAATLQEVSSGRLLLGIGAGGGAGTPYATEQWALGRTVLGDNDRRHAVERTVSTLRTVWSGVGETDAATGFLRPDPSPPVIIGGFGPKMAALAGRVGDGINMPGGPNAERLIETAREANAAAGQDPARFIVTASANPDKSSRKRLEGLGVDRMIVMARPPYVASVEQLASQVLG